MNPKKMTAIFSRKSVIYSTAVLAIGLGGVMAISGQRDGQEAAVVEPAAGGSDMGIDFSKTMNEAGENIQNIAAEASETAEGATSAAQDEMSKALESVDEEVENLAKPVNELAGELPAEGAEAAPESAGLDGSEAAPTTEESAPAETF